MCHHRQFLQVINIIASLFCLQTYFYKQIFKTLGTMLLYLSSLGTMYIVNFWLVYVIIYAYFIQ